MLQRYKKKDFSQKKTIKYINIRKKKYIFATNKQGFTTY